MVSRRVLLARLVAVVLFSCRIPGRKRTSEQENKRTRETRQSQKGFCVISTAAAGVAASSSLLLRNIKNSDRHKQQIDIAANKFFLDINSFFLPSLFHSFIRSINRAIADYEFHRNIAYEQYQYGKYIYISRRQTGIHIKRYRRTKTKTKPIEHRLIHSFVWTIPKHEFDTFI